MHVFLEKNPNLTKSPILGKSLKDLKKFLNHQKHLSTSQQFQTSTTFVGTVSPQVQKKDVPKKQFPQRMLSTYKQSLQQSNQTEPQRDIIKDPVSPQKKDCRKKQFSQRVVEQLQADIARIKQNRTLTRNEQRSEMQYLSFILIVRQKIIYTCRLMTRVIKEKVGLVMRQRQDRDLCCSLLKELLQHCAIFRNHAFQLMINYHCARINFYYKKTHKCILLLKTTKQHAYLNQQFDYIRMKVYQCLGECFMNFRPNICKSYLTKFLQMTWRLNCTEHELKAYEMMGKYYFYVGFVTRAQFYHQRFVDGIVENENSPIRKLALSKVQNAFLAHNKQEQIIIYALDNNDGEYVVSSDEESFDFLIANSEVNKPTQNIFLNNKKKVQKFTIRTTKTFDTSQDQKTVSLIHKNANQNIRYFSYQHNNRQKAPNERFIQTNFFQTFQRSNTFLGQLKDRVLVSHLSPNRELGNYQTIELLTNCSSQNSLNQLQLYNELHDMIKIKRILAKMILLAKFMEEQLVFIERDFLSDFEF